MEKEEILKELIKIHTRYSFEKPSKRSSPMCTLWSVDDPPDTLMNTEPLEKINELMNENIGEEYAVSLYDMNLEEAAESLSEFKRAIIEESSSSRCSVLGDWIFGLKKR